jgi:hypothetical protein
MVLKKRLSAVVLRCGCGKVVKLRRRKCSRQVNRAFLCNGKALRGRIGFRPPFHKHRVQYEVRVIRSWEPTGQDRYILYHVNREIRDLLFLSRSLGISQAWAVWVFNRLSGISSTKSFVAFKRDYAHLGMVEAVERWTFISEAEFSLLNAS